LTTATSRTMTIKEIKNSNLEFLRSSKASEHIIIYMDEALRLVALHICTLFSLSSVADSSSSTSRLLNSAIVDIIPKLAIESCKTALPVYLCACPPACIQHSASPISDQIGSAHIRQSAPNNLPPASKPLYGPRRGRLLSLAVREPPPPPPRPPPLGYCPPGPPSSPRGCFREFM
jgi:hypothetical protein